VVLERCSSLDKVPHASRKPVNGRNDRGGLAVHRTHRVDQKRVGGAQAVDGSKIARCDAFKQRLLAPLSSLHLTRGSSKRRSEPRCGRIVDALASRVCLAAARQNRNERINTTSTHLFHFQRPWLDTSSEHRAQVLDLPGSKTSKGTAALNLVG